MNNTQKVYKILSDVLGVDINSINLETGPDNVENWDSFNALMLISEFESVFKLAFTLDDVANVRNIGDIIAVLKKHGVAFDNE